MQLSYTQFAVAVILAVAGCAQGTPGGPGTTGTAGESPVYGQADNTFNLSVPIMSSSLQQGEKEEATIGIKRGKNFDEDVALKFENVPKGITIAPANSMIKHGDSEARITFQAQDGAPLGDYKIKVIGHPTKGSDGHVEFKLSIAAKDTFHLSIPGSTKTLKQGESQTVSVDIKRDKRFDQDVALQYSELPAGISLEPSDPVIKNGETDSLLTLKAADDAALGEFTIKVVGQPTKGADAHTELKMIVIKP